MSFPSQRLVFVFYLAKKDNALFLQGKENKKGSGQNGRNLMCVVPQRSKQAVCLYDV